MGEYISREKVIERIKFLCELREIVCNSEDEFLRGLTNALNTVKSIELIPIEDVQPVVHAQWVRGEEKGFRTYNPLWYCSNCGGQIRYDTRMRQYQKIKRPVWEVNAFCRKCGARMDGDTE